jgi:hypothetical protein
MLCRIAHILRKLFNRHRVDRAICFDDKTEVSNSDQLLLAVWAIIVLETSTSASLSGPLN